MCSSPAVIPIPRTPFLRESASPGRRESGCRLTGHLSLNDKSPRAAAGPKVALGTMTGLFINRSSIS